MEVEAGKRRWSGYDYYPIACSSWIFIVYSLFGLLLSRKREYLADAGSVRMTGNALALASSLRKISGDPRIEAVKRRDVAQLFIENPQEKGKGVFSAIGGLFATHPPIEKRIQMLEQF